ncbi:Tripeptidyl-peptidase sed1 [Lecanosticta acicola]|uniref:Tripeptidyl-peptidase sed1 n=1 Tax=Lecanosticta acicola TaxID=111012 RepID=A0AAI8YSA8_9PEZI|nr:Tripeptidyl-peptidase sed1 [Lecanosticta acicola]
MILSNIVLVASLFCIPVLSLPRTDHVLHEKRSEGINRLYRRGARVPSDAFIPLRIGLVQQNLETGHERLMAIAHPDSPQYGQHLTAGEIHDIFQPSVETFESVRTWLVNFGVEEASILQFENRGWLAVNISVRKFEEMFKTELFEHEHIHSGQIRVGCEEYSLPRRLRRSIDYITPGVKLSAPMRKRSVKRSPGGSPWHYSTGPRPAPPGWSPPHDFPGNWSLPTYLPPELQDCGRNITPACERALYDIPIPTKADSRNTVGLFEVGDHYAQADLNLFYAKYAPRIPQGTSPVPAYVDGAIGPVDQGSEMEGGEAIIDIATIASLVYPQTVTLYQTEDQPQAELELQGKLSGFLNTFLDALDGSYCNYSAYGISGNSPGIDASYPDNVPGGYNAPLQCGVYTPARVISISYGESESDLPINYQRRQCNEFMKLGLQGHTIFFSSGDFGVAAAPGDGSDSGCLSGSGQNQTVYAPNTPASCPYVTSVGGTQLNADETVHDPETALQQNMGAGPLSLFASHGGFSNYFSTPSYQQQAVENYFKKYDPGHPYYITNEDGTNIGENGGIYNRAGRGIPDVSSNGANFHAFVGGVDRKWFGTSLAAPTWASIITLINEERTAVGKGPVGFVNPVLYENTDVFTDITNGSNPNCGSSGFTAQPGWDPVTGLGTPRYPKLLQLFMGLP